jgi:hypothetical protein
MRDAPVSVSDPTIDISSPMMIMATALSTDPQASTTAGAARAGHLMPIERRHRVRAPR